MMLVRRGSWLLGGQLPLRFTLHYCLLPTLSLVLPPSHCRQSSPGPGGMAASSPGQGTVPPPCDLSPWPGACLEKGHFKGGKSFLADCGCTPCTGLRAPREAGFAGVSSGVPLHHLSAPQSSTLGREEQGFTTGGS